MTKTTQSCKRKLIMATDLEVATLEKEVESFSEIAAAAGPDVYKSELKVHRYKVNAGLVYSSMKFGQVVRAFFMLNDRVEVTPDVIQDLRVAQTQ